MHLVKIVKRPLRKQRATDVLKISNLAKLSQVSVKALRYYDDLGLFKPGQIDRFTGYRYYTAEQLPSLHRILALKDLGFSLEQIGQLLDDDVSTSQMRGLLHLKQTELEKQIANAQEQVARIEVRLKQLETENRMPTYDVILKPVNALRVAAIRDTIPSMDEIGPTFDRRFDEVDRYIETHSGKLVGPAIALYHDAEPPEMNVEAAEGIQGALAGNERVHVYQLPTVASMAFVVYHGPFATLNQAYQAVLGWIEANGYHISGSSREIYVQ